MPVRRRAPSGPRPCRGGRQLRPFPPRGRRGRRETGLRPHRRSLPDQSCGTRDRYNGLDELEGADRRVVECFAREGGSGARQGCENEARERVVAFGIEIAGEGGETAFLAGFVRLISCLENLRHEFEQRRHHDAVLTRRELWERPFTTGEGEGGSWGCRAGFMISHSVTVSFQAVFFFPPPSLRKRGWGRVVERRRCETEGAITTRTAPSTQPAKRLSNLRGSTFRAALPAGSPSPMLRTGGIGIEQPLDTLGNERLPDFHFDAPVNLPGTLY